MDITKKELDRLLSEFRDSKNIPQCRVTKLKKRLFEEYGNWCCNNPAKIKSTDELLKMPKDIFCTTNLGPVIYQTYLDFCTYVLQTLNKKITKTWSHVPHWFNTPEATIEKLDTILDRDKQYLLVLIPRRNQNWELHSPVVTLGFNEEKQCWCTSCESIGPTNPAMYIVEAPFDLKQFDELPEA